jgi:hypothetical protein
VGVVSDPELVWATGFGLADRAAKTPMTPQTTFRMASGGGPVGEIVRFVEENGRVVGMITGDSYVERVRP